MAKVAFIQNLAFEYLGTMYLSSMLKNNNHRVEVFIDELAGRKKMLAGLKVFDPDIIGFSCTTGAHLWALKTATFLKRQFPRAKMTFGGAHPTFYPEIIEKESVDIICRGEGEHALLELADRTDKGDDCTQILNLWVKKEGRVFRNDVRPLIENLDTLPFPDRGLYVKKYPILEKSQKAFILGRGCPFSCTYCFNQSLKELYRGKGPYVRLRSIDNCIREIREVKNSSGLKTVYLQDDTFGLNRKWSFEFLTKYKQEVGLVFICLVRADLMDEDTASVLKAAGCKNVFFGVESGCEKLRRLILGKDITDVQIQETGRLLKKYKIRFRTYNIFGLPGETLEDAFQTVRLNIKIGTDFPWSSLLQPFPGTELGEYVKQQSIFEGDFSQLESSFFKRSPLKLTQKREIENLHKLFFFAVKFPFLLPLIKRAVRFPLGGFYDILFLFGYMISFKASENLTWQETLQIAVLNLKKFFLEDSHETNKR